MQTNVIETLINIESKVALDLFENELMSRDEYINITKYLMEMRYADTLSPKAKKHLKYMVQQHIYNMFE